MSIYITKVDIVNGALYKIGAARISKVGENSKFGLISQDIYDRLRDEVLESHPWAFAIEWIELSRIEGFTHPDTGDIPFQLPENVLRPLEVSGHPRWRHEKDRLFVGDSKALVKCIVRIVDEGRFSATFAEALACRLAMEFAYSCTNSASLKKQAEDEYDKALAMARTFSSQSAGTPPRAPPRTSWARGRGLGYGYGRY